ncbi:MAG: DUF4292 domain-containing protein [Melioribacteraceae bacterium]|nr:DUF4292 domain-containing protein [Melioribacteraceae bacterium]MCF8266232.1 DUF4292 domain-containing protein [Melioribacteraceae bacterium]MCF8412586.1 DUF4292 domain-containing protein [Melioribacteraceae bacterium]MCF8431165.1 DUF4292 domain-containing protein [Melioribacteraceae bacterium]
MKKIVNAVLLILLLVIVDSCAPAKPEKEEAEFSPDRIMVKMESNRRKIKTFYGKGVMGVNSPEFSAKTNFEVRLVKPDSIRLSISGPLGFDIAEALVTKDDFTFYDVLRNKVYTGKNREGVLRDVFKVDFSFDDIMDAFAGAVNLTENLRKIPDEFNSDNSYFYFNYRNPSGTNTQYIVDQNDLAIKEYSLTDSNNKKIFEGFYSDFRSFEGLPLPYKVIVKSSRYDQNLDIEYRLIEVNKPVSGLVLKLPKDVEYIEWKN